MFVSLIILYWPCIILFTWGFTHCLYCIVERLGHVVFKDPSIFRKHVTQLINVTREAIAFCGFELSGELFSLFYQRIFGKEFAF